MLINSGPLTLKKLREHSVATAFASKVYESQMFLNNYTSLVIKAIC